MTKQKTSKAQSNKTKSETGARQKLNEIGNKIVLEAIRMAEGKSKNAFNIVQLANEYKDVSKLV